MVDPQAIWQSFSKYLIDNKDLVRILLSISGVSFLTCFKIFWQYRNENQKRKFPTATPSPFKIIRPHSDVLSVILPGNKQDPLADTSITYQDRCPTRKISIRKELIRQLDQSDWLLIEGRTGLGKTREAGELAQLFNKEGWTVLCLKWGVWVDEPTPEHLSELKINRKLLFLLDDLNQRMYYGSQRKSVRAENSPFEPLTEPLQTRLLKTLQAYEQFCGRGEIKVIATARNEKYSDIPGEPNAWDKLEKDKYPKFWQRFTVYELPEPEDEAISQLLRVTIPETSIYAKEENYLPIARQNDSTFRNVVENLVRLQNRELPLIPKNYKDTLKDNWDKRYRDAIKRYPQAVHIYEAVDLLRQLEISLTREIIQPTALLILDSKPWQLWQRYSIDKTLNYLIDAERILAPRDGQIEARDQTIESHKYLKRLTKLVLGLNRKQIDLISLLNLALNLNKYSYDYKYKYFEEALACLDKSSKYFSQSSRISFIHLFQGIMQRKLERYGEALQSYDKALELKSDYYQAYYNKGILLVKLERYEEALQSYDKALELKPDI